MLTLASRVAAEHLHHGRAPQDYGIWFNHEPVHPNPTEGEHHDCCFQRYRMPDVTFPDTMIAARVSTKLIERAFLQQVWDSASVCRQIESVARTTNGTFKVNQFMLEGLELFVPPGSLQREFARRTSVVEALRVVDRNALSKLDSLFASLQYRAFRGEL